MKPGRELDALVAEKVMGWKKQRIVIDAAGPRGNSVSGFADGWERSGVEFEYPPEYSISISAAWEIVEKLRQKNYHYCLYNVIKLKKQFCQIYRNGEDLNVTQSAETAPHAICLAALKAVGV